MTNFEEMAANFRSQQAPNPPPQKSYKKRRGSFLNALGFFIFFFLLIISVVIATAYSNRDRLILEYLRQEGALIFGVEVFALDSIVTRPVGQISVEIRNLVFQASKNAPSLRAQKVLLSTPKNLLSLYQLMFTHDILPLKAQLVGVQLQATTHPKSAEILKASTAGTGDFKIEGLPFPISFEAEIRDSILQVGPSTKPVKFQGITGIIRTEIFTRPKTTVMSIKSTGQLALGFAVGERAQLPIRTDWEFTAEPSTETSSLAVDVTTLSVSTLGITLKSTGKFKWPEQTFAIEAAGSTTDLGVLPVDKAESDALGLTGRLKGNAEVNIKASGALGGVVVAQGLIRLKGGHFPFDLARENPRPFQIKGPAELDLEAPFKVSYDVPNGKLNSLDLQLATFKLDLTAVDIRVPGLLRKPAQLMMAAHGQVTAQGETVEVSSLELRLANLLTTMKGQVSIDPKRTSKLDVQLTLPSLNGWPGLLPILGQLDPSSVNSAGDLTKANGSFALKAQVEVPLAASETLKTASQVSVEMFEASNIEFPINIKEGKHVVEGILRGSVVASGSLATSSNPKSPMSWNLKRAQGSLDLKHLKILWDDLFDKPQGQEASIAFNVSAPQATNSKGSDLNLKIDKFDIHALSSNASVTGQLTRDAVGDLTIDTGIISRVILSEVYVMAPFLRATQGKFPSGTLVTNIHTTGTYKVNEGLAGSPLAFTGRIAFKAPQAVLLDMKSDAPTDASPAENGTGSKEDKQKKSLLHWPMVSKAKLVFDLQFDSIAVKTAALKNIAVLANIQNGNLRGSMAFGNAFGGPVKVTSFAVADIPRKEFKDLKVSATGQFQTLNLAHFVEFLSPQWQDMVGGVASGTFTLSGLPFHSTSLVDNAQAAGSIAIKQGFFSTVSLDQLVSQKLADFPVIAKLLGAKPKVATKGVSLEVSTAYSFAKSRMTLEGLRMLTPERNELTLGGWLQKDLTAQLAGFAYLSDTSIGGSFRQANSDKLGRLVVPIKISGSLKEPSLSIAEEAVTEMTKKMVAMESGKIQKTFKREVQKVIEQKKKEATKGAVDAVKDELKKRGLSF